MNSNLSPSPMLINRQISHLKLHSELIWKSRALFSDQTDDWAAFSSNFIGLELLFHYEIAQ